MITEDDTAEFKISWETGPLVSRPGFGFYPDSVWNWLDKTTEVITLKNVVKQKYKKVLHKTNQNKIKTEKIQDLNLLEYQKHEN